MTGSSTAALSAPRLQMLRFLIVGGLNTLVGYGIYLAGLYLGLAPEVALAVATVLGATFNYFSTARYVFAETGTHRFPAFIAVYTAVYLLNAAAIRLLIMSGVMPALAQALLLPVAAVASFLLLRRFVFPKEEPR